MSTTAHPPRASDVAPLPAVPRPRYGIYAAASAGIAGIFIVNGIVRELGYSELVGELAAHQISTLTVAPLVGAFAWGLERRWPLPDTRSALTVGGMWVAIAIGFELGFGHFVAGAPWSELGRDYDLRQGRLWGLVLVGLALAPELVRRARRARGGRP